MDEQQFRKIMINIRALARKQGERISKEQVHKKFLPLNMEEGQFLLVYRYLNEENVRLYETEKERIAASDIKAGASLKDDSGSFYDELADEAHEMSDGSEDSEYLKLYLEELENIDIPGKDERSRIIGEILKNRDLAAEKLPGLYLREVVDVARLYQGQGAALEDLIGEGNIGVLTGIGMLDCCDTSEEVDEFMMKMIMDSMESLIMESFSADEFDVKVVERVNELNDRAKEMAEELERLVTVEELAAELEKDEEYIKETIRLAGNAIPYIEGCRETVK